MLEYLISSANILGLAGCFYAAYVMARARHAPKIRTTKARATTQITNYCFANRAPTTISDVTGLSLPA